MMSSLTLHKCLFSIFCLWPFLREVTLLEETNANCLSLLEDYAAQTSNFTECIIRHARPITVCQSCVQHYINVVQSYENITKLKGDVPGEICRTELINVDRLEVIVDNYKYVTHQWERALCFKCFQNNSNALNAKTINILSYLKTTEECISRTNHTSHSSEQMCRNCSDFYFKLNDFYDSQGSFNEFCMDIIDAMNTSRVLWSLTLGCCSDRKQPQTIFLMTVIAVLFIPILFYLLIWVRSMTPLQITSQERWTRPFVRMSINQS